MRAGRLSWLPIVCAAGLLGSCSQATRTLGPVRQLGASSASDWLGLNYNSDAGVGSARDFVAYGVVYDRAGWLEPDAGQTATPRSRLAQGLCASIAAGMTPDIEVDPASGPGGCTTNPNPVALCLPTAALRSRAMSPGSS